MSQNLLVSLYNQKRYQEVRHLVEANGIDISNDPMCTVMYLNSVRRLGDIEHSLRGYENAFEKFSSVAFVANGYGNLLVACGELEKAIAVFKHGLSLRAADFDLNLNCARAMQLQGDHLQSKTYYFNAARLRSSSMDAHLGGAEQLLLLGELAEAEQYFTQLFQAAPNHTLTLNGLVRCKRKLNKLEEASSLLVQSRSIVDSSVLLLRSQAAINVLLNQTEAALISYERALSLEPHNIELHNEIAHWLWTCDDADPFRYFEQNLGQVTTNTSLWRAFAQLLVLSKQYKKGKLIVSEIISAFPSDQTALLLASEIHRNLGDFKQAVETSAQLNTDFQAVAINEHAYNLMCNGDSESALQEAEKLIELEPNDQGWWNLYATCLRETKSHEKLSHLTNYNKFVSVTDLNDKLGEEFLQELKSLLNTMHSAKKQPIGQSLHGGSQTLEDLFDNTDPLIQRLKNEIILSVIRLNTSMQSQCGHPLMGRKSLSNQFDFTGSWSVKLNKSGFHNPHFHPAGWLSGVFYVEVPKDLSKGQGWLEFGRANIPNIVQDAEYTICPKPGRLVLFPSYVWHGTRAFESDATRMTVAFDVVPKIN